MMPGQLEAYIEHYQLADRAMRALRVAIGQAANAVAQAQTNPLALVSPQFQNWPSREQLQELARDAQAKITPLQAEYGSLAAEFRNYAPLPLAEGINASLVMKPADVTLCDQAQGITKAWSDDWHNLGRDMTHVLNWAHERRRQAG
jgi:hypothetical protein